MITYELAKQLYKKGSPFKSAIQVTESNMQYIDFPLLSELIKSCGVDFGELVGPEHNVLNKWFCGGKRSIADFMWEIETTGDTPEEVVAKLWLELNKKI